MSKNKKYPAKGAIVANLQYKEAPMFTEDDVLSSQSILTKLFRQVIINEKLTESELKDKFISYYTDVHNYQLDKATWTWNNNSKPLRANNLPPRIFEIIIVCVLGYKINALTLELEDENGKKKSITTV